jgi:hypothetical protein
MLSPAPSGSGCLTHSPAQICVVLVQGVTLS